MMTKKQPFLMGTWQFTRHIDDKILQCPTKAEGTLTITQNTWQESGTMNGMNFCVEYALEFQESGGMIVNFPDGRLFYTLTPINENASIDHLCGDDFYKGEWIYHNTHSFDLIWTVKGPRKNYRMVTQYTQ